VADPIRYRSTNRNCPEVTLAQALLAGQAPDRGLYMPTRVPELGLNALKELQGASYPEVAHAVLTRFAGDEFGDDVVRALCEDAYTYEVPVQQVTGRRHLLRLDRGPTASFKDFAARMMGRLIGRLIKPGEPPLVILTATSGDTGSAVAQAFAGVHGVQVMVLFPVAEVSDRQRRQMTTIGGNVTTLGVHGKFDDCQAMVKRAFADPELSGIRLSSANSINIGRLLPQAVYYVWAYLQVADVAAAEPVVFSVPCGNFGDLCGGLLAQRMGLPVRRFVVATNANDEVPLFFASGQYAKIDPSRVCISNAMNVGHPSNLARLVDLYGGRMDETGALLDPPDMEALRRDLWAVSINDAVTRETISGAFSAHGALLEPHGAVGWAGLERFFAAGQAPDDAVAVSLETAHPAKFPEEVVALTGKQPPLPTSLAAVEALPEAYDVIEIDYPAFKARVAEQYSGAGEEA